MATIDQTTVELIYFFFTIFLIVIILMITLELIANFFRSIFSIGSYKNKDNEK
jgi:hypothetical protein